jgi:multidrug efflux pump subunit AcrA (membrane-fusion protein)
MINVSKKSVEKEILERYKLNSLATISTPRVGRVFTRWVQVIVVILLTVLFLPWQQNISGVGRITAFNLTDRPQEIQSFIAGRIERWYVNEGDLVKAGDTLLLISEIKDDYLDPEVLLRTNEQILAKQDGIGGYNAKITALNSQIEALNQGLRFSLQKARNKVLQSQNKVVMDSTDLIALQKNYEITVDRLERFESGHKQGLFSLTDLETRRLKLQEESAKVVSQQNKLAISRQDLINARIELNSLNAEYQDKIAKAMSDRSSAVSNRAEGEAELSKLKNKYSSIEVRQKQYYVLAPQDGYLVKAAKEGIGETIKEGENIATLQPTNPEVAVELYIRPMDVPLVSKGREVRLEFDGWPALQFSGWPGMSIGTFGGTVFVVDQVNSVNGRNRLLIKPKAGEEWPEVIRMGSGVYGWVMLNDVPVWYEIWRQLNGFPPDLSLDGSDQYKTQNTAGDKK